MVLLSLGVHPQDSQPVEAKQILKMDPNLYLRHPKINIECTLVCFVNSTIINQYEHKIFTLTKFKHLCLGYPSST